MSSFPGPPYGGTPATADNLRTGGTEIHFGRRALSALAMTSTPWAAKTQGTGYRGRSLYVHINGYFSQAVHLHLAEASKTVLRDPSPQCTDSRFVAAKMHVPFGPRYVIVRQILHESHLASFTTPPLPPPFSMSTNRPSLSRGSYTEKKAHSPGVANSPSQRPFQASPRVSTGSAC